MNTIPARLDHLVLATPDLAATVADFTRRTGVAPAPGGVHIGFGTRNYLVSLGGTGYLEIIGPDPEQPEPRGPRPFDVDTLAAPRTVTWAISPPDLDAAVMTARARGYDPGMVHPMSRRRPDGTLLEWRLTDGETQHPSGLPATPLLALSATAPDPGEIRALLAALDTELTVTEGPVGLSFTVDTPLGPVSFD